MDNFEDASSASGSETVARSIQDAFQSQLGVDGTRPALRAPKPPPPPPPLPALAGAAIKPGAETAVTRGSQLLHPTQVAAAVQALQTFVDITIKRRQDTIHYYLSLCTALALIVMCLVAMAWLSKQTLGQVWDRPPESRPLLGGSKEPRATTAEAVNTWIATAADSGARDAAGALDRAALALSAL